MKYLVWAEFNEDGLGDDYAGADTIQEVEDICVDFLSTDANADIEIFRLVGSATGEVKVNLSMERENDTKEDGQEQPRAAGSSQECNVPKLARSDNQTFTPDADLN